MHEVIQEHEVEAHKAEWPGIDEQLWKQIKKMAVGSVVWDEECFSEQDLSLAARKYLTIHKIIDFY